MSFLTKLFGESKPKPQPKIKIVYIKERNNNNFTVNDYYTLRNNILFK